MRRKASEPDQTNDLDAQAEDGRRSCQHGGTSSDPQEDPFLDETDAIEEVRERRCNYCGKYFNNLSWCCGRSQWPRREKAQTELIYIIAF